MGPQVVIVKHAGSPGLVAGLLGCAFGILGIFTFGLIFVPLAAICSLFGLLRAVAGLSISGIGCSLMAAVLTVWGFAVSPSLWVLVGAGLLVQSKPAMDDGAKTPAMVLETSRMPAVAPSQNRRPLSRGVVPNALVFRTNPQGHIVVDTFVNGAPVRFLVDTGATTVVLTLKDAAAAGLSQSDLVFSMRTSTANGVARAAPVRLRELRIDQLMVRDVAAAVVENLSISLLGQSFLTRIDGYEMRDGVLTLSYW